MKPVRNLFFLLLLFCLYACKKESFTNSSSALLTTTTDTLHFDTVFTTTGSVTQFVKIVNNNSKGIHVSSVILAGGTASPFKINVDGIPGPDVGGIDISANDSIYVFVTVSINPNASNPAFIVQDSIEINYNGRKDFIQLDAYGQNAHFFRSHIISSSETWDNDLPYVILGGITINQNVTLTINEGCRIYMHADAPFIVNGSLKVNGDKYDSTRVIFTGDRLDEPYRGFPASYPGIIFTELSTDNVINYAIIKNAYQGIYVSQPAASGIKLSLNETIIDNAFDAGLLAINTSIRARNVLVSNCGKNVFIVSGGSYDFSHCTIASFSNSFIQHREPVFVLTDFLGQQTNTLDANFTNCIFWGEENGFVVDEVVVLKQGNNPYTVVFDQVLWRVQNQPANASLIGVINNLNPGFDSLNVVDRIYSFRPKEGSPAIDKGVNTGIGNDLDGLPRPVGLPDLGAYERQ
jgi:hypothetical protein